MVILKRNSTTSIYNLSSNLADYKYNNSITIKNDRVSDNCLKVSPYFGKIEQFFIQ